MFQLVLILVVQLCNPFKSSFSMCNLRIGKHVPKVHNNVWSSFCWGCWFLRFRKVLGFGEFLNHVHPKLHGLFYKKTPNEFRKKKKQQWCSSTSSLFKWRSHFTIHRGEMLFTPLSSFLPSFHWRKCNNKHLKKYVELFKSLDVWNIGSNWTSCGCKNLRALYNWLMLRLSLMCFVNLWWA